MADSDSSPQRENAVDGLKAVGGVQLGVSGGNVGQWAANVSQTAFYDWQQTSSNTTRTLLTPTRPFAGPPLSTPDGMKFDNALHSLCIALSKCAGALACKTRHLLAILSGAPAGHVLDKDM